MMRSIQQKNTLSMWSLVRPYRWQLVLLSIISLVQVALTICLPLWMGKVIDSVIRSVSPSALTPQLFKMFGIIAVSACVQWGIPLLYDWLVQASLGKLRQQAFAQLHCTTIHAFSRYSMGDLTSRLTNDIEQLATSLTNMWQQWVMSSLTVICMVVTMATLDVTLMLVIVGLTPLSLYIARFISNKSYCFVQQQLGQKGKMVQYVEESLKQCDTLQMYNATTQRVEQFQFMNAEYAQTTKKAVFYQSLVNPVTRFVNAVIYSLVVIVGLFRLASGNLTVGELSAFLQYATHYTKPFNDIASAVAEWQTAKACMKRLAQLFELQTEELSSSAHGIESIGDIHFQDVSFGYDERLLFNQLTMTIPQGKKTAIIGPTGAGKSSVLQLLLKFYPLQAGDITFDGVSIQDIEASTLYRHIGMVFQQTWLPTARVHDIIAYGNPQLSRRDVVAIARQVGADYFISQLPQGYDTVLEQESVTLSQGQQQLLAIARVMAMNPSCIIVDEATSALDTRTEQLVQQALDTLMAGRTAIVIAHRLKTIRNANNIVILDKGQIVAQGTHVTLMQNNEWYRQLNQH